MYGSRSQIKQSTYENVKCRNFKTRDKRMSGWFMAVPVPLLKLSTTSKVESLKKIKTHYEVLTWSESRREPAEPSQRRKVETQTTERLRDRNRERVGSISLKCWRKTSFLETFEHQVGTSEEEPVGQDLQRCHMKSIIFQQWAWSLTTVCNGVSLLSLFFFVFRHTSNNMNVQSWKQVAWAGEDLIISLYGLGLRNQKVQFEGALEGMWLWGRFLLSPVNSFATNSAADNKKLDWPIVSF